MSQPRIKSAPIAALLIIVAICISAILLVYQNNAQLALMSIIIPISLIGYLYPRHIYLVLLLVINAGGYYLSSKSIPPFDISTVDLIVFNLLCIFSSELLAHLKRSYNEAIEKFTQQELVHQKILEKINIGVTLFKNNERIFTNDQLCKITGYSANEIEDFAFRDLACPDEIHKLIDIPNEYPGAPKNYSVRIWIKNKNKENRFIENTYFDYQLDANNAYTLVFTSDLTDQKKKEDALEQSQKSLSRILSNLPGLAYRRKNDSSLTMEFVSDGAKDLTGYSPNALVNNSTISYADLIHPDDRLSILSSTQKNVGVNKTYQLTYRIITANQEIKWIWEQGRAIQNTNSNMALEGFIVDITDRVLANQALIESEQQYKALANSITDIFMALDNTLTFTYWNKASERITGIASHKALGRSIYVIFHSIKGTPLDKALQEAVNLQKTGRFIQKLKINGEEPFLEINIYPSQFGVAIFGRDVTERIEAETQLKYLSTHDALTRIYSRAYFETEMLRLQNSRLFPISVVMADLDGLKYVNDSQGHAAGDELLRETANLLKDSFRTEDVVARIGGDEFGVLIANTGLDAVHNALKRVRLKIKNHNTAHPNLKIKLSIGVATSKIGENLEDTAKRADKKMYEDKSTHKGDTRELNQY